MELWAVELLWREASFLEICWYVAFLEVKGLVFTPYELECLLRIKPDDVEDYMGD